MFRYDVFLICPVRLASEEQKQKLLDYVSRLESRGLRVYYPERDTDQADDTGLRICQDNVEAIRHASEVHIYFDPESKGTLFDLGAAFTLNKKLVLVNQQEITLTQGKSFANMITEWSRLFGSSSSF